MKKFYYLPISLLLLCASLSAVDNLPETVSVKEHALKIRIINFKTCIDGSKLGKQEQTSFEALKKQMESVLAEKEKTLNEIADKFEDPDYLDSLSAEAETELKRKFRSLSQELNQLQGQYMEALRQSQFKVMQQLNDMIVKAANTIAKNEGIDLILNEEGSFYANPSLDISAKVIALMDEAFEKDGALKKPADAKPDLNLLNPTPAK